MIQEVFESVRDAARERLRNPLPGAFLFAWAAINWKVILLIAKSTEPIETIIVQVVEIGYLQLVVAPFVAAIAYVVVSPWTTNLVESIRSVAVLRGKQQRLITK